MKRRQRAAIGSPLGKMMGTALLVVGCVTSESPTRLPGHSAPLSPASASPASRQPSTKTKPLLPFGSADETVATASLKTLFPGVGWWCWGRDPIRLRCWRGLEECNERRTKALGSGAEADGQASDGVPCQQRTEAWCFAQDPHEGQYHDGICVHAEKTCNIEIDLARRLKVPQPVSECVHLP